MKHHDFRYRQFLPTIILQCMRWYLRYPLSYRNLEEMMEERGVDVDPTTLYRWVQKYAPELEKRIRWRARTFCKSWHLDETYNMNYKFKDQGKNDSSEIIIVHVFVLCA